MKKKGLLLLVGLFVLFAAACATTGSNPSSTASGSPGDVPSASTSATGTPDDVYQSLIGEWRGDYAEGGVGTLIIREIDMSKRIARGTYSVIAYRIALVDREQVMDLIPGPNPKLILQTLIRGGT